MIIILIAVILMGIILAMTNRKRKRKSVMIRNVKYRQMDEPLGMIDYSMYCDGLGGEDSDGKNTYGLL